MALFKPKPNLALADRARIEFFYQRIFECVGLERIQLPVQRMNEWLVLANSNGNVEPILNWLGQHLNHDVSELQIRFEPGSIVPSGGGG